jgi:hypothetical protein
MMVMMMPATSAPSPPMCSTHDGDDDGDGDGGEDGDDGKDGGDDA